ncbi:MAG TPA: Ig-like domain-containing protein, partial [Gemmatimonadales bacterium]|nr:Ig-like domain-containing protein [Gemmatimonadales bacterium]
MRALPLFLIATCQVDKLTTNPPPIATLDVAPVQVRDSAAAGSAAARADSVAVSNAGQGTLSWSVRLALGGQWLSVSPSGGVAPAMLHLSFNPVGLASGVYRDTLLVIAENARGSPALVPVEFVVHPCSVVPITPDVELRDSLTTHDCSAPHKPNSFARVYGFTARAGDSISVVMTSATLGGVVMLDTSLAGPALTQGVCTAGCIRYQPLQASGNYLIEAAAGAGQTGPFTLRVTRPRPPAAPGSLAQLRTDSVTSVPVGGSTDQAGIVLRGVVSDPDLSDTLRLEVEVQPVGTPFAGAATGASGRLPAGVPAFVALAGLANNTAYHWQARTVDQTERASAWTAFGGNPETDGDFVTTIPQPPAPPTDTAQFQSDGATAIPVGGTASGRSVIFKATVTDPNPGDQLRLEVEVKPVGTAFNGVVTGTGPTVANGTVATAAVAGLSDNTAYHWRSRAVDQTSRASAWVPFGNNAESATDFRVAVAATQLTFTVQPTATVAGVAISPAVRVVAQDALGNTLTSFNGSVTVALASNPGGDTLSGTKTVAAQSGVANFADLSVAHAGAGYTLQASATISGTTLTVTSNPFTISPADAKRLVFTGQPSTSPAGAAITPAIQVTARDSFGNTATGFAANVTLAIGNNAGGGTLSGTATQTAVGGVASFSGLTINKAGTGYTLTAAATGLATGTSASFNITAAAAGQLAFTTAPSSAAQSGVPFVPQPVLQVEDTNGNAVATQGVTVTAAIATGPGGAASVVSNTATTDQSGLATFAGLAISGPTGSYTLTFTAPKLAPLTSGTITLAAGPPAKLAFITQPSDTARSGIELLRQPVVQLQDAAGNSVSQASTSVTAAIASGGPALSGTNPVATDGSGRATFVNLTITGLVGPRTLSFSAGTGITSVTSSDVTVVGGTATQIAINAGNNQTVTAGTALPVPPSVIVKDASGNPVPGVAVTFSVSPGNGTIIAANQTTDAGGIAAVGSWTLSTTAGTNKLTAAAQGLSGSPVTFTATGTAGNAGSIAVRAGDNQTATVNTAVATPPAVIVKDANGNPVQGVSVTFAVGLGSGSITGASQTTDAGGIAAVGSWTLGTTAGANTLTATAPGVNGSPVTFTAQGTAGAPGAARSLVAATPGTITASTGASAATITVTANDQFGNPVSGVTVALAATGANNALAQPTGPTGANGQVTGTLSSTKAEIKTVTATLNGATVVTATANVSVSAAAAAAIAISAGDQQGATVGTAVLVPPAVIVRDAFGNPVAGVAVTFAPGTGGGGITGAAQTTNASGVAAVTSWTLGNTAGPNTLTATSGTLQGSPVTFNATGTAGAAAQIAINAGDGQQARVGTAVPIPPSAIVKDQHGNPVAGVAVTFAPGTGGGSVNPTSPVTTGADGIAAVTSWTLGTVAGPNTLTAASGTLAGSPVTFTATATAGNATRLAIVTQPSASAQSGVPFLQQPVIQLQDGSGNAVGQANVAVGVKIQSGGGTLGGTTSATTGANGQAVFINLSIAGTLGPRTLRFGASGLDSVTSATVSVTAGTATQIAINAGDGQSATTGTAVASPPSVIVRDASNNPVQGVGVTFAPASGGGSITGAEQTTNANGIATVGSWTLGTTAGTNTLTAAATGLAGSPVTFTATGTAGPAASLAKFSGDNQVGQVGTTLATPHTVLVTDAHGNPVNNVTITWAAASGGGSVNPTSSVTDAAGHASTTRTLGPTPGQQTTTASATGLTPVTFIVQAQVGGATQMAISGGQQQTDTVGHTLPVPLSVRVADALNNSVPGVTISWSVLDGGGSVNPLTSTTNTSGIASTNWTLGTAMTPTDSTQTAQATGVGSALSFTAFTVPGAVSPTQTSVVAAPATITASSGAGASTITVTARDQYGNVIKGKTVTLAVTGNNNALTQPSGPTGTNGVATGALSSTLAQSKTVSATVGTVAIAQQATVTVTPAAADTLAWLVQPSNVAAGAHITPALQVEVRDQFGNRVTAATAGITLAIGTNAGGGALTVTPRTAVSGVATFDDASIDKAGSGYTLVASSGGLGPVTSNPFNVSAAAATSIAPSAGSSQAGTVGTPVQTPPAVIVRDQFNNPVAGVAVTFTPAAGSGSVSPTTPIPTNASGVAALTSWTLGTTPGSNTLTATSSGLSGSPVTFTAQGAAGPATQIAVNGGSGQVAAVGTAVATPPSVIVRDQFANPVAGVAVTFSTTGDNGTVDPAGAVTTNASGIAALSSWTLGTTAKTDTLRATAAGLAGSPVTFTATATAGGPSAAQSTVAAAPETITAGLGASTITVTVRDANGNPVSGATVTLAATPTTGNTLTQPAGTTNGSGQITGSLSSTAAGAKTVTATVNGTVTVAQTATVTVNPAGASASQSLVAASPGTITASTGSSTSTITVTVKDENGNPVSGATVTLAAAPTTGITLTQPAGTTNASGQITGALSSTAAGAKTVTATVNGSVTVTQTATVTVSAAAAASIAPHAGNGQTAPAGTAVLVPPSVIVTDAFGNPASGVSVTFAPGPASGSVTGATQTTDASGIATVGGWTLSTTAGSNTLTASSGALSGSPVTFTATGTAGPAAQIAVNGGNNQTATVGNAVPIAPSVIVRDQFGNPVAGVAVTFTPAAGSGTVSPTSPVTSDAGGIAAVTSWTLGATAGTDTLRATATGLAGSPVVFLATATAGGPSASQSSVAAAPATITAGSGSSTITVTVRDAGGNPVSGATVTLAATPTTGNTLTQPAGTTDLNGQVTGTLSSTAAGTKTITASVNGTVTVTQTATVNVTSAAATTIAVHDGNGQTALAGTAVPIPPSVLVTDEFGNAVAGVAVTFAVAPGNGTITGGSQTTNASGVATVGSWTLSPTAGQNTLTASSGTLSGSPVTFSATGTVGAAATIAANSPTSQTAPAGTAVSSPPSVLVKDANGNPVAGVAVTFAVAPGNGTITGGSQTTNASGVATVGSWTLSATAGPNTLTATSTGLSGSPVSFSATGTAGTAATIAANSPTSQSASAGTAVNTPPSVIVKDANGNPVAQVAVTFAVAPGNGTITGASQTTNASGVATVGSWTLSATAGPNTLTATSTGLSGSPVTFSATGTAGTAATIAANSATSQSAPAGTAVSTPPSVIVKDANGNPVAQVAVTFAVAPGNGTITGGSQTTNASGVATVGSWTLSATAGPNTLTATSTGLSGSPVTFSATGTAGT